MKAKDRGPNDHLRRDHVAESPELAHALWLVRRLGNAPVASAEIEAARERVRARVFAAIAAARLPSPAHSAARLPFSGQRAE